MAEITKVSDITVNDLIEYIRTDDSPETQKQLSTFLSSAKSYISSYTGLTAEQIDSHPDIVVAVYVLCQDMYDNRTLYVDKGTVSPTVQTILEMYSVNLI